MSQLAKLLKIRRGEGLMASLLIGLMIFASAGITIGSTGVDALFFARFGAQYLPYMYVALGVTNFIGMLAVTALLGRIKHHRLFILIPLVFAIILIAERVLLGLNLPWFMPIVWLLKELMNLVQGTYTWGLAGLFTDTRQAKRLFPLFTAGSIFGAVAGSFGVPLLVNWLNADNLLIVWAISLAITFVIGRLLVARLYREAPTAHQANQPSLIQDMQAGFQYVKRSKLMTGWSIMAIIFSVLWFSIALPFSKAATAQFPDENTLASFLATFNGIQTAVALVLSLFFANRVFARFGVINMLIVFPVVYLIGFAAMTAISIATVVPLTIFTALVVFKFAQMIYIQGVADTAWQAAFNVVPAQRRDQVRAFINGVPGQAGILIAGLILVVGESALQPQWLHLIGLAAAIATVYFAIRSKRAYSEALIDALREGQPQVFITSDEEPFGGFQKDATAIKTVIDGLSNSDPAIRRVSIEILGRLGVPQATDALVASLRDPDSQVRADALRALATAKASSALLEIAACLNDLEPEVRAAAVESLRILAPYPQGLTAHVRPLLQDATPSVRARVAVALLKIGSNGEAQATLQSMIAANDFESRIEGLKAAGEWRDPIVISWIEHGLSDSNSNVRRTAALAMNPPIDELCPPLIRSLGDEDRSVREAAAFSIGLIGPTALSPVIDALSDPNLESGALIALEQLPVHKTSDRLFNYARQTSVAALQYHDLAVSLRAANRSDADDRLKLLIDSIHDKSHRLAINALHAIGLLRDRESIFVAIENLKSRDPNQRANAMETLDSVGEQQVIKPLLRLWEGGENLTGFKNLSGLDDILIQVMTDRDAWIRACSTLIAKTSIDPKVRSTLAELARSDPDETVRLTAATALEGDTNMESIKTLPLMERILFLRRVALFADLAPADLKAIASIAGEQFYSDGDAIMRQGEPGTEMYIIASGEVRVMSKLANEEMKEVARRTEGEVIGEMAIISHEPRTATLLASGDVRTLCIDQRQFESIIRERPETSLAIMRVLIARVQQMAKVLQEMGK
jgi:HEAT repeat protein